jgi:UDP-N-acetylglucosamine/UDP-N-acetylgalactosamine diphosphorylase
VLERWAADGVEVVCTFQVDNPLLMVVDPDFIGRLLLGGAPLATKVVLKRSPDERVGLVARAGGRPAVLEYSELDEELANARDALGGLRFRLGSIGVHAFELGFLRAELARALPLHRARKRIATLHGAAVGYKYERFVFDLFPRADEITVVEALREREFEPLKNAEGDHSPESVRAALDAEYRRWFREAGREPPPDAFLELSPLDAIGPEDLSES